MLTLVTRNQQSNRISVDKNKETHTAQISQLQNKHSDKHVSVKCDTSKQNAACLVMQGKDIKAFNIIVYNLHGMEGELTYVFPAQSGFTIFTVDVRHSM